jgi:SEC-C motif-containing protein
MPCPCGSELEYDYCCGPYLGGETNPPTAEALMRSRYTAYARGEIDYIANTLAPEKHGDFDRAATTAWATQARWLGLKIHFVEGGRPGDTEGVVAFVATYERNGKTIEHHEVSQFRRGDRGEWLFVSGDTSGRAADRRLRAPPPQAVRRSSPKVGRNDPCPCGTGRKYKMCCGR